MVTVMGDTSDFPHLIRRADIEAGEETFSHPWNENSEITGTHLSGLAGLARTGVSLVRVPPGKESFASHLHHREEEWVYILTGRGVMHIDGNDYEMAPGDFVAFPTPSVAHNLANPFDEDVVYLMGGECREYEIADFPTLDRRMVRTGKEMSIYRLSDGKRFDEPLD